MEKVGDKYNRIEQESRGNLNKGNKICGLGLGVDFSEGR